MLYSQWEPFYYAILKDTGFSEQEDLRSAEYLSDYVHSRPDRILNVSVLEKTLSFRQVVVCGNSPYLIHDLTRFFASVSDPHSYVYMAADGATSILLSIGILPDVIVTDLDGTVSDEIRASSMGSVAVIHAHGDNMDRLKKYVSSFARFIPTCQCRPPPGIFNFGGFTDGDRCLFIAEEFLASKCVLVGFDFADKNVTSVKQKKLNWADKLIQYLINRGLCVRFASS